jgi:predicted dehydrogenase
MKKTIKVGVIGIGYWGPNIIRNFNALSNAEIVMASDLSEERLSFVKKSYPHIAVTHNYRDLFNKGLDGVVIVTPPSTHFSIAEECLRHNLHVMIEKPLTTTSADAEKLINLAGEKGLTLMVGHTFVYNSAVHALKNLIDNNDLGDIYYLDAARLNLGLVQEKLNVIWDLAPHDISIMNYLVGENPLSVSAHGICCVNHNIHDVAYLNLVYPNNNAAHIHVSWLDPCKVRRVTVVGSKKMAVYNDVEISEKIRVYDKGVEPCPDDFEMNHYCYHYGEVTIPPIAIDEPLRIECQHFVDCIINHARPVTDGEAGLKVVKIIEAAQRSLLNNGEVEAIPW